MAGIHGEVLEDHLRRPLSVSSSHGIYIRLSHLTDRIPIHRISGGHGGGLEEKGEGENSSGEGRKGSPDSPAKVPIQTDVMGTLTRPDLGDI